MTRAPSPLVVIDVVGLSPALLGANTPALNRLIGDGFLAPLDGVFPAVTCTAQASMLTGKLPREHGNGWYFRDLAEVWLWRQSNHLVQAEQIWDRLKREQPDFRCAQMFWWYNMYGGSDWSVTPRPIYPADGRKLPGLYSKPAELHRELEDALGPFPLFNFWGPAAGLRSSRWIADSARAVFDRFRPSLQFVYLPHLDYDLQRLGPSDPGIARAVSEIDAVVGELVDHLRGQGAEIMIVSEYGIEDATGHVHINQILRQAGQIGEHAARLCQLLFAIEGRVGQRKLWGIVGLVRRYPAHCVNAACAQALEQGIYSFKRVQALTEALFADALEAIETQAGGEHVTPTTATLTQQHELIRDADEYGDLFAHAAATAAVGSQP